MRGKIRELTFGDLRRANTQRLPKFKGRNGQQAHSQPDGSDWTPATWLMAVVGELGEYAEERWQFETGMKPFDEYEKAARGELADVSIYLDLLAMRCLDITPTREGDAAVVLQRFMMYLGNWANMRKKMMRGDITHHEFVKFVNRVIEPHIHATLAQLMNAGYVQDCPTQFVSAPHGTGVRLWQAIRDTFNKVSRRIGCGVEIHDEGVRVGPDRGDVTPETPEPGTPTA